MYIRTAVPSTTVNRLSLFLLFCSFLVDIIEQTEYTATFGVRQYTGAADDVKIIHGFGLKIGPEAGQLLIHTAHPGDICPCEYFVNGHLCNNCDIFRFNCSSWTRRQ